MTDTPQICDYEGATYRTDFWEGKGRDYEDRVERVAIKRLMPLSGGKMLELGAGFGRLSAMYQDYEQVVVLDYSRSQLEFAREQLGDDGYLYVAADIYSLPFAPNVFDAATMVRVIHHLKDAPQALGNVREVLKSGSVFLLEYANKQNIKAILRYGLKQQQWNPFSPEPIEFVELNFNFHPSFIDEQLRVAEFEPGRMLTVSHYRINLLKRLVPTGLLVALDSFAQLTGNWWQLAPSVFVRTEAAGSDAEDVPEGAFWRCPNCGGYAVSEADDKMDCTDCGASYAIVNGVYDFKAPL